MRRLLLAAGMATGVAVVLSVPPAHAATQNVSAVDNQFQPKQITVNAGDTVIWRNSGNNPHTVTADDGSFDSGTLSPGQTFSRTFQTATTIPYHCSIHGAAGGIGMSGTIVIKAAATSGGGGISSSSGTGATGGTSAASATGSGSTGSSTSGTGSAGASTAASGTSPSSVSAGSGGLADHEHRSSALPIGLAALGGFVAASSATVLVRRRVKVRVPVEQ